jgi:hypothetical protein
MKLKRNRRNRLWERHEKLQQEVAELSAQAQKEYDEKRALAVSNHESSQFASTTESTRESTLYDGSDSSLESNRSLSYSESDSTDDLYISTDANRKSCVYASDSHEYTEGPTENDNNSECNDNECKFWSGLVEIQEATKRELSVAKEAFSRIKYALQMRMASIGLVHENGIVKEEDKVINLEDLY